MRKTGILLFFCFVLGLSAQIWHYYTGNGSLPILRSVSTVSYDSAWVVGDSGNIWYMSAPSNYYQITDAQTGITQMHWDFHGCAFWYGNNGFIVGERNRIEDGTDHTIHEGIILRTLDGGNTWDVKYSSDILGAPVPFYDVAVCRNNTQYAYIGAGRGIILKTTDGGNTWTSIQKNPYADSSDVFTRVWVDSSNAQYVWAVADNSGLIVRSKTGGASWDVNYQFPRTYDIPDFAPFSGYYPAPAVSAMDIDHSIIPLAFKRVGRYDNGNWYVDTLYMGTAGYPDSALL